MKKIKIGVPGLIIALVIVLVGGLLFVGAVSGWFDGPKLALSEDYLNYSGDLVDISAEDYDNLVNGRESFIVFVDQGGCTTADRLRGYVKDWAAETGIKIYRIMFPEMKETSLHEHIKYYPSVAMIMDGRVIGFLRADKDEDAKMYNDYGAFKQWMENYF